MIERRKQTRSTISCPVYFIGSDKEGNITAQDIAAGLNINAKGMLIESSSFINARFITILATKTNKETVKVKGEVIYSMQVEQDRFRTGIAFHGTADEVLPFTELVKSPSINGEDAI